MRIFFSFVLTFNLLIAFAQQDFAFFFAEGALRIDYTRAGDSESEYLFLDEFIAEPFWGGTTGRLLDDTNYGDYFFEVYDLPSETLIYSRGYSTLFSEWKTTEEAQRIRKSFSETLVMPFPKNKVKVVMYTRNYDNGLFEETYLFEVDPADSFIKRDNRLRFPSIQIENNGKPSEKVDIVILPEGYQEAEMKYFIADCKKFTEEFFAFEPYKSNRTRFNIWAVAAPSKESGADIPEKDIWKNTILNLSYYTFGSERYLMTTDNKSVRDLAANAPYDQIYILVNSPKYGGGGIFNHYCVSVNGNEYSGKITTHEFGHGFACLADEYVGDVSYNDMHNLKLEPVEANITTLVNFDKKWKDMLDKDTPVPTPLNETYKNRLGVFEGAAYVQKGMYRPVVDCLMHTFAGDTFCPVCSKAIEEMIDLYAAPIATDNE